MVSNWGEGVVKISITPSLEIVTFKLVSKGGEGVVAEGSYPAHTLVRKNSSLSRLNITPSLEIIIFKLVPKGAVGVVAEGSHPQPHPGQN